MKLILILGAFTFASCSDSSSFKKETPAPLPLEVKEEIKSYSKEDSVFLKALHKIQFDAQVFVSNESLLGLKTDTLKVFVNFGEFYSEVSPSDQKYHEGYIWWLSRPLYLVKKQDGVHYFFNGHALKDFEKTFTWKYTSNYQYAIVRISFRNEQEIRLQEDLQSQKRIETRYYN